VGVAFLEGLGELGQEVSSEDLTVLVFSAHSLTPIPGKFLLVRVESISERGYLMFSPL
jgi:hypothetical protein